MSEFRLRRVTWDDVSLIGKATFRCPLGHTHYQSTERQYARCFWWWIKIPMAELLEQRNYWSPPEGLGTP